jgi:hypothetical protein
MGFVRILVMLAALAGSFSAQAEEATFKSKSELFKAFYQAGFDRIIEVDYTDWSKTPFLIHTPGDKDEKGTHLQSYAAHTNSIVRVPALDYTGGNMPWNKHTVEAYVLADVFLCYLPTHWADKVMGRDHEFTECLIFPIKIMDVLKAVQVSQKRAVPTGVKDDGRPTFGQPQ